MLSLKKYQKVNVTDLSRLTLLQDILGEHGINGENQDTNTIASQAQLQQLPFLQQNQKSVTTSKTVFVGTFCMMIAPLQTCF